MHAFKFCGMGCDSVACGMRNFRGRDTGRISMTQCKSRPVLTICAHLQALRFIRAHGLCEEGKPCATPECDGILEVDFNLKELRCNGRCQGRRSLRGEFFGHYKNLGETFMLMYAAMHRWQPRQVKEELNVQSGKRYTGITDNIGDVCTFAGSMKFKSEAGTWRGQLFCG